MQTISLLSNLWRRNFSFYTSHRVVFPTKTTPIRLVPDHIKKPCYFETGEVSTIIQESPEIKSSQQIQGMIDSCKLASKILNSVKDIIKVGTTTDEIDAFVHEEAIKNNAYPSPLHYKGFPKSVCTSVNNVACHGIPDLRRLANGDIINVDVTIFYNNFHGDCSKTFLVGDVDEQGKELVSVTLECLNKGISICGPNVPFREIGRVIQEHSIKKRFSVVPAFTGHGIGEYFHGPPDIFHANNVHPGNMQPGMTFTIEPVLTCGDPWIEVLEDGWTAVTVDKERTAQFEHTILVTEDGCKILTE